MVKLRRVRVRPDNLIVIVPHCLQKSGCRHNIIHDINSCKRCRACNICELLSIVEELGVRCYAAAGGRQAAAIVKDPKVEAIVAVACEKELTEGILAAFPKPVVAVINKRPNGPCKDTCVDVKELKQAIRSLLQ